MSLSAESRQLLEPFRLGDVGQLKHRIVMAPLTRLRSSSAHVPPEIAVEYYAQRSSVPGTLIIAEGTFFDERASGLRGAPGIWSDDQIRSWKRVTDAVHANGSFIVLQLYGAGHAADPAFLSELGNLPFVSASNFHWDANHVKPRPLSALEVKDFVKLYGEAARNAVERAGFDGVELHMGNGYLMDCFLQTNSNTRTDEYGGSLENRLRFPLEALEAIVNTVGERRVGFRVSPWSRFQGMRMSRDDIVETFSELFTAIRDKYPNLAYAHVIQPRVSGAMDDTEVDQNDSDDYLRAIWSPRPYIAAGAFNKESAERRASSTGNLIAFGRFFISNPDLPKRLQHGLALASYDRRFFYSGGAKGYTDYPFAVETPASP